MTTRKTTTSSQFGPNVHFSSKSDEWSTPWTLYRRLDEEFHFTLDVAATAQNAKCARYFTREDDGLSQSWKGERVFCNPPYGRMNVRWWQKMDECDAELCVALLPARTDTRCFHEHVLGRAEIRFVRGRIHFNGSKTAAPFPSIISIWRRGSLVGQAAEHASRFSSVTYAANAKFARISDHDVANWSRSPEE